jgi:hypothetical protein
MLLLAIVFLFAAGQNTWQINDAATTCGTATKTYWEATVPFCTAKACTCANGNCVTTTCISTSAFSPPSKPANLVTGAKFYRLSGFTGPQCNDVDLYQQVFVSGTQCTNLTTYSAIGCCNAGNFTWTRWSNPTCTGAYSSLTVVNGSSTCTPFSGAGYILNTCPAGGPNTCPTFTSTTIGSSLLGVPIIAIVILIVQFL